MHAKRSLVVGLGLSGAAAAERLVAEGFEVTAVDDNCSDGARQRAEALGIDLLDAPDPGVLAKVARSADQVVVSPGVAASHPIFGLGLGDRLVGEVELAFRRMNVPVIAVTGTNGKTTVVTLVEAMLRASGVEVRAAGNIGRPLMEVAGTSSGVVVAEVSSFQLALTRDFHPSVATWLNFAPDHLDWHPDLCHYRRSKEMIWQNARPGDIAVANVEDPVVLAASARVVAAGAGLVGFGLDAGDWHVSGGRLLAPGGTEIVRAAELVRRFPHDLANSLAAAATACSAGASLEGCREALLRFRGLPHRLELVGEAGGVRFYDDSKATTPASVLAALRGFHSVVLIAGGRNKGLELSELRAASGCIRAVVAIGEAAPEIVAVFSGACPVEAASSMEAAVAAAVRLSSRGDAVVLSPGCASFDWYSSYAERGDDFVRCLRLAGVGPAGAHSGEEDG